ncbi:unnamed protein product [Rotaria sp. Silwood1]|nr:unnamed protein product [Rotaria sp. Silwood1]
MNIELVSERQYKAVNNIADSYHRHRKIWQNIKNLLKSCFHTQSNHRLLNHDGTLIDINHLQQNINDEKQSSRKRHITWPYLLNIFTLTITWIWIINTISHHYIK